MLSPPKKYFVHWHVLETERVIFRDCTTTTVFKEKSERAYDRPSDISSVEQCAPVFSCAPKTYLNAVL